MNDDSRFDVVVIGSGPGGYVAAIRAAQLGMRTAIVEKDSTFGGTCLNVGCIPSKALLESSHRFIEISQNAVNHGIVTENVGLDLVTMMARKDKIVGTLCSGVGALLKANKVTTFAGQGSVRSGKEVEISQKSGDAQVLTTDNIILATGSIPASLAALAFDHNLVVDSTDALCFETVPDRLIVVGAGAVGLELASVWARLGAKVTVVELMDQLIPGCDSQVSRLLERVLSKQGIEILLESSVTQCNKANDSATVTVESRKNGKIELIADKVLVAVGRRAFTEGLGLDDAGVTADEKSGCVLVDERFMTNVEGIYAIGDVIAGPMLAHKAQAEGIAVAEIISGKPGQVNYNAIPAIVYTEPEVAVVGKTQEQLDQLNTEYKSGIFHFKHNGRALAAGSTEGFVKILADKNTDRVLGVHMIGPWVSDLIAEVVTVMEFGGSAEDIALTVHSHPTLSEVVIGAFLPKTLAVVMTMSESAHCFVSACCCLSNCSFVSCFAYPSFVCSAVSISTLTGLAPNERICSWASGRTSKP
jgi:dihydrolipoamide dehydrogenase